MTGDDEQAPRAPPQAMSAEARRKHRLAAALRENLKRRKMQARERKTDRRPAPAVDD